MLTIKILFTIDSLEKKKKLFIQNTIYNIQEPVRLLQYNNNNNNYNNNNNNDDDDKRDLSLIHGQPYL